MASDFPDALIDRFGLQQSGAVLAGEKAPVLARQLARMHPGLPVLIEPNSVKHLATSESPFILQGDGLFSVTAEDILEGQRQAGATFAVTPSGQIPAGDPAILKAVVKAANDVVGDDILTMIAVSDRWLVKPLLDTLVAVLKTSRHPVLLSLVNSSSDPLARKGAVDGYRRLAEELGDWLILWRTDLSGLGAMSCGALAAVVGVLPSMRRLAATGKGPRATDKTDQSPHVLLGDLLRFSRSSHMHTEWFASTRPLTCACEWCRGSELDRFDDSAGAKAAAHLHNAAVLSELAEGCRSVSSDMRPRWWRARVAAALDAHIELSARISRPIAEPDSLKGWHRIM